MESQRLKRIWWKVLRARWGENCDAVLVKAEKLLEYPRGEVEKKAAMMEKPESYFWKKNKFHPQSWLKLV